MTHFIIPAKTYVALGVTAVFDLLAMITSEQMATWFQIGTLLGIAAVAFMNRIDARKSLVITTKTAEVTEAIHALSNSAMLAQLRIVWLQAKRISEMTKQQVDMDIAAEAEKAYLEHEKKQSAIDAGKTGHVGI